MADEDHGAKVFRCAGPDDFIVTQHAFVATLQGAMRDQFSDVCVSYLCRYGVVGCYERMSGRTLSQICTEFQPDDAPPIAEGEVNGVRYQLFQLPESGG